MGEKEKEQCSQKVPYIKKECSDMRLPMEVILLEIFLIYPNAQTKLTKTPKTYTLILITSEVILASPLILIVRSHMKYLL